MDVVDGDSEASERNFGYCGSYHLYGCELEEVRANNRSTRNTTLFNVGQSNFLTKFNEHSGRNYSHQQLKNKLDCVAHTI